MTKRKKKKKKEQLIALVRGRGIDASVARGYAKQLSWNAVSCSETRVDVMRLTRARILAGSYARASRLRDSTKLLHPFLSFIRDDPRLSLSLPLFSLSDSLTLSYPFSFRPISSHSRANTARQLIRETRGASLSLSLSRARSCASLWFFACVTRPETRLVLETFTRAGITPAANSFGVNRLPA